MANTVIVGVVQERGVMIAAVMRATMRCMSISLKTVISKYSKTTTTTYLFEECPRVTQNSVQLCKLQLLALQVFIVGVQFLEFSLKLFKVTLGTLS